MKNLIEESISPIVYHFCPLSTMLQIAETDKFRLSSVASGKYESDTRMNSFPIGNGKVKTYPYYMCFSRTPSSLVGYQYMRMSNSKGEWDNALVRLEIDGNALNTRYKGAPVNFFTKKDPYGGEPVDANGNPISIKGGGGKNQYGKKFNIARSWDIPRIPNAPKTGIETFNMPRVNRNIDYAEVVRTRMSEYEDRIFSNKEEIDQAIRYIRRIDILLDDTTYNTKFYIAAINNIYTKLNGFAEMYNNSEQRKKSARQLENISAPPIYIFTDKVSFNSLNVRNANTVQDLNSRYKEASTGEKFFNDTNGFSDIKYKLPFGDMGAICELMVAIAFKPNFNQEQFNNDIQYLTSELGLDRWDTYDGYADYSDFILNKCNNLLDNLDVYYSKNFNSWNLLVNGFYNKHQGSKKIMTMFMTIMNIATNECAEFSKKYGFNSPVGVFSTLKRKCNIYYSNKDISNMTNDESFIDEMERYNYYINDKTMTVLISRYNKKYDYNDEYVVRDIDLNLVWNKFLKKIYPFYEENGYIDDYYIEKMNNWVWKNYKDVAYPYHNDK